LLRDQHTRSYVHEIIPQKSQTQNFEEHALLRIKMLLCGDFRRQRVQNYTLYRPTRMNSISAIFQKKKCLKYTQATSR